MLADSMDSPLPKIAQSRGYYCELKAGSRYLWCSCGRSANQPFCDGSHAGTGFLPVLYEAKSDEEVIFCGCKQTGARPFCDGAHNNLPGGYTEDDPESQSNRAVPLVARNGRRKTLLDGGCYVFSTERVEMTRKGAMAYCPVIGPWAGAQFQSQLYAKIASGSSPVVHADGCQIILFMMAGSGDLEISGRHFPFSARTGACIRPQEAFRVHNQADQPVRLFISTGPAVLGLTFSDTMPDNFDERYPNRLAEIDPAQRQKMAARFFQILVNRQHGATEMTQFIGNIPRSKAEPHRHLYEEALIFLEGQGMVWTEHARTPVGPDDVLFLPRKLTHSVQCTSEGGLDVVGVICPGDNPSISY
jgi:CDGSH-type Zn-finger protein/mannose-6-phosphate isomerase-like protein (cupin superfamily)